MGYGAPALTATRFAYSPRTFAASTLPPTAATTDLGQGDLQAQVSNFRSVLGTVSGLTWGWVYGLGSRRGVPGLFFLVGLAYTLVQLCLATAPLAPRGGKK